MGDPRARWCVVPSRTNPTGVASRPVYGVDAAFMQILGVLHNLRKRLWLAGDKMPDVGRPPGGIRDAGDAQVLSRGACCACLRRQNAVKPGIQYVLAH